MQLLGERGARLDERCEGGNTALHHAIQMGEYGIARLLVACGANTELKNTEVKLAGDLCSEGEWEGIFGKEFPKCHGFYRRPRTLTLTNIYICRRD